MLAPHRRQFIIGPKSVPRPSWCHRALDDRTWLSYDPELSVHFAQDQDGCTWGLLGHAVTTTALYSSPQNAIAHHKTQDIPSLYSDWAGRWLLVRNGEIHLDASGLLSCFYGTDDQNRLWCSSSLALIAQVLSPQGNLPTVDKTLTYRKGISWYIPPESRLQNVQRLLPSQILNLAKNDIKPRPLMPPLEPEQDAQVLTERLNQHLTFSLKNHAQSGLPLWLGLSAGYDSRTLLAIAYHAGISLQTFTRITFRMSLGDRTLPPQLANATDYPHQFCRQRQGNAQRQKLAMTHTHYNVSVGDAQPFVRGVRSRLQGMCIGGQCFGIGKTMYRQIPPPISDPKTTAAQILKHFGERATQHGYNALMAWLEWALQTPQKHLDWRDRFSLEQRLAGWQSAKEQLYDLDNVQRGFPVNCSRIYSLLLSLPESDRTQYRHQIALIQRHAPALLHYPINPPDREIGLLRGLSLRFQDDPLFFLKKIKMKLNIL
jgi:hypothetical protein